MIVKTTLEVSLEIPDGSIFLEGTNDNQIILPTGQVISVQPVIEMRTSKDADDHRDIATAEAEEIGVYLEYDRWTIAL